VVPASLFSNQDWGQVTSSPLVLVSGPWGIVEAEREGTKES
jgi:hypothetical protein